MTVKDATTNPEESRCEFHRTRERHPEGPFFVILAPQYYCGMVHYRVCNIALHLSSLLPLSSGRYEFSTLGQCPGFNIDSSLVCSFNRSPAPELFANKFYGLL